MNIFNIISFITFEINNLEDSKKYYNKIFQWEPDKENESFLFYKFQNYNLVFGTKEALRKELEIDNSIIIGSSLASINTQSKDEVDKIFFKLKNDNHSQILVAPTTTNYGGYRGYFKDINNHIWEIVYNPNFKSVKL